MRVMVMAMMEMRQHPMCYSTRAILTWSTLLNRPRSYFLNASDSNFAWPPRTPRQVLIGFEFTLGNPLPHLRNTGTTAALANKLTLLNTADGLRILPAYYSDNYVSLLPGENRDIEIEYPSKSASGPAQLTLRGWNLAKQVVSIP
jgi:hypothetical protein